MLPVYKFYLQGVQAFPVIGDAVAIDFEQESEQKFFRKKWSGKLTFIGADYTTIVSSSISTKFTLRVDMAYNAPTETIFEGHFYKTDCEIDEDAKTVVVTPSPDDEYNGILEGLEKEFNLVKLAPSIESLLITKRPIIQVYCSGDTEITCILSGMSWTQPCESETNGTTLTSTYKFTHLNGWYKNVYSVIPPEGGWANTDPSGIPNCFVATDQLDSDVRNGYYIEVTSAGGTETIWLTRDFDGQRLWWCNVTPPLESPAELTMVSSYGFSSFKLVRRYVSLYARVICDSDSILGVNTSDIPQNDITENTRNYKKVVGYNMPNVAYLYDEMSETPTELGRWDDGLYWKTYTPPAVIGARYFPICRNWWDSFSLWWSGSPNDWQIEEDGRVAYPFRDAYPLWSVISVLLSAAGAGVSFAGDTSYSRFLYGDGGNIRGASFTPYLTPKSNLVSAEYDEAAQRGNISLKQVFDMLRDCFRCYWFIDSGKLRIEHIEYFRRGGSYSTTPSVGVDLTTLKYTRTNKPLAYGQSAYKYDKPETYGRIQFGWMDDVTAQFNGSPIDIISPFVNKKSIEDITLSQFTTDVDYIIANPSEISKDGFVLFGAIDDGNGNKVLPFVQFGSNGEYDLQNGYLSFMWLQNYYMYDLPAPDYEIDGVSGTAIGTMPLKTQEINFPHTWIPNLMKLVKTNLGDGQIKRLSFELLSMNCKATLNYGTT